MIDFNYKEHDLVILRSNELENYIIAKYIGDTTFGKNSIPTYQTLPEGDIIYFTGIVVKYDDGLRRFLNSISYKQQYIFLKNEYKRYIYHR